jgi:hypothetical protein
MFFNTKVVTNSDFKLHAKIHRFTGVARGMYFTNGNEVTKNVYRVFLLKELED